MTNAEQPVRLDFPEQGRLRVDAPNCGARLRLLGVRIKLQKSRKTGQHVAAELGISVDLLVGFLVSIAFKQRKSR